MPGRRFVNDELVHFSLADVESLRMSRLAPWWGGTNPGSQRRGRVAELSQIIRLTGAPAPRPPLSPNMEL